MARHTTTRYGCETKIRLQPVVLDAVELAARSHYTSPAEYLRQAIVAKLREDKIPIAEPLEAA